ncbi:hypothetical protein GCM10023085_06920 [Actinomadura viridis]|uniref:Uncharacterized protein n=1 Tax=Actinomadura viridis TaxID=58110 RepID=A0A931DLI2_9ACTN|nr:hypothetical protein [Actinomadura viridis]MBG6091702.1 hypothetical protein [Actinomadura viridis]
MTPNRRTPPLPNIPPAKVPAVRPYIPPTWAKYIKGDFNGMSTLAGKLYAFAQAGNPRVDELTKQVNGLLGYQYSVSYSGSSADSFKASYGQDAAMMSAINKLISAAAGIIDTLASRLATLEQRIEIFLSDGFQQGYFLQDENFRKTNYPSPNPGSANYTMYSSKTDEFDKLFRKCSEEAQKARELAAAELSKVADALMEGLDYYRTKTGTAGTLDPKGLLRTGQLAWYSPRIEALRKELGENKADLGPQQTDLKSVLKDMQSIGAGAQQVGDVISAIPAPPAQRAGETLSAAGGVLSGLAGAGEYFAK